MISSVVVTSVNVRSCYPAGTVHSQQALSTVAGPLHVKDDRSHQSSPGSPVVFAHAPPKEQMSAQLYHNSPQLASISAAASPIVSSSSHSCSLPSSVPAQQQSTPSVNLQAVAKYVDKNLANHVSGWPTDIVERQVSMKQSAIGTAHQAQFFDRLLLKSRQI